MAKKSKPKKSFSVLSLILGLVLVLGLIGLTVGILYSKENAKDKTDKKTATKDETGIEEDAEPTGILLTVLEGEVELTHKNKKITVTTEADVNVGDKIETLSDARAIIVFEDNSIVTLDEKTQITIDSSEISETNVFTKIKQEFGRTWTSVKNLAGVETDFQLETPNATAAVRGTEFDTDADESGFDFYLEDGQVDLVMEHENLDEDFKWTLPEGKNCKFTKEEIDELFRDDDLSEGEKEKSFEEFIHNLPENYEDSEWFLWKKLLINKIEDQVDGEDGELDRSRLLELLRRHRERIVLETTEEDVPTETDTTDDTTYTGLKEITVNAPTTVVSSSTFDATWTTTVPNTEVDNFLVSVGSSYGKQDKYLWTFAGKPFDGKKYFWRFKGMALSNKTKYFVQVLAKLKDGTKSKVFYDTIYTSWTPAPPPPPPHTGSITINTPTNGGAWGGWSAPIGGNLSIGNFTNPGTNTYVRISIQDASGVNNYSYWKRGASAPYGGSWQAGVYYHAPTNFAQRSSTTADWSIGNFGLICGCQLKITAKLFDATNNALLNTKVITVTENW